MVDSVKEILSLNYEYPSSKITYVEELLQEWEKNKKHFIDLFGGLIYECPNEVSISLSASTKRKNAKDFCSWVEEEFPFADAGIEALANFIYDMGEALYENTVPFDYVFFDEDSGYEKTIPAGAKITKAFKNFVKDKEILIDIQNEASRIIQQDKIAGTLCFSVHPFDFLSISDNLSGWQTCHNMFAGDYRTGNLSYLLDKSTFVCYIKAKDDVQLPTFPMGLRWNNKKWRVLMHANEEHTLFMMGRQYPFAAEALEEEVRMAISCLTAGTYSQWQEEKTLKDKFDNIIGGLYWVKHDFVTLSSIIKTEPMALNYQDIRFSKVRPKLMRSFGLYPYHEMYVGANVKCLCCGDHLVTSNCDILCAECSDDARYENITCECCHKQIEDINDTFMITTNKRNIRKLYCKDCYEIYIQEEE